MLQRNAACKKCCNLSTILKASFAILQSTKRDTKGQVMVRVVIQAVLKKPVMYVPLHAVYTFLAVVLPFTCTFDVANVKFHG